MKTEKVYCLTLDIKNDKRVIERSISEESGDLTVVLSKFPLALHRLLKEIHEDEVRELRRQIEENDVPF